MPKILDDNALRRLIEAARGCEEVDVIERAAMREYLLERPSARNGTGLWRSARRFAARTTGGGAARGVLRGRAPGCPRTTTPGRRACADGRRVCAPLTTADDDCLIAQPQPLTLRIRAIK